MMGTPTFYIDDIQEYESGSWCHLWSNGTDEQLDVFARTLGLKHSWAHLSHGASGRFYHYDLRPSKRLLALKHGAVYMPLADWIRPRLKIDRE